VGVVGDCLGPPVAAIKAIETASVQGNCRLPGLSEP
jgi:hypothetical protein